jgi:hypothetical protein
MRTCQISSLFLGIVGFGFAAGCGTGQGGAKMQTGGTTNAGAGGETAGSSGGPVCDFAGNGGTSPVSPGDIRAPWDWAGVVGTGQSLAVGQNGSPLRSTTQPYNNLKLSTGTAAWPVDPNDTTLSMVQLTEPIGRRAPTYPSSWPENIAGETMHSSMGNQITALVTQAASRDYVSVQGEFGENGQCYTYLRKGATENGVNGRAYAATLIETQAITRLAQAAGKTYGVGAITVVHGECDAGNSSYEDNLVELWTDYNADIPPITGQTESIPMLLSQQNSTNDHSASTLAQWKVGVDHPADFVCVGPTYQYESSDGTHLFADGYRQLGEKFGQVYFERVVLGRDWQPLGPTSVERDGRVITVHFHVPVPPLVWDTILQAPHQSKTTQWALGKGFEVRAAATNVTITSVEIVCDAVRITVDSDLPASGVTVSYALYGDTDFRSTPVMGTKRWGLLRDSDPFVGSNTQLPQPNYCVAFELPVP